MGLREAIVKAVGSAYTALGNIPEAATYRRVSSVYNPATGGMVTTNSDTAISKAIFTSYDNMAVDKINILATDLKLLIQQSELSITPNIATDRVIRLSDGKVFNIIRTSQDPVRSLHILQLRSPS